MANGLALNPDKADAILLGTAATRCMLDIDDHVKIAGAHVELSDSVKLLGVHID